MLLEGMMMFNNTKGSMFGISTIKFGNQEYKDQVKDCKIIKIVKSKRDYKIIEFLYEFKCII